MNLNSITKEQWLDIMQLLVTVKGDPKDFFKNPKTELGKQVVKTFESLPPAGQIAVLATGIEIHPFCVLGFIMGLAIVAQAEINQEKTNAAIAE